MNIGNPVKIYENVPEPAKVVTFPKPTKVDQPAKTPEEEPVKV